MGKKKNSLKKTGTGSAPSNEKQRILNLLEKYKGTAKGVWDEDAQVYVNKLRDDDRPDPWETI